ncbi:MAG: ATP-binding protein, partial [Thermodesulfobacteriota bacterium]|nr:ATP-binding protein [Thermodesulfobacteriota bacterium]
QHNLQEVIKASHRAKDLVKQILTFGQRGDQNRLPLKVSPVLKEIMALLQSSLPGSIEIRQDMKAGFDVARIDPREIHQVMMNLCTNAAQAMKKNGGGLLEVGLVDVDMGAHNGASHGDLEPGPYLRLRVSDTGDGMDEETMKRIFDPFFTTRNRTEGTGMGLAVVHGIVKNWGGKITVESAPGRGTVFNVFIPRVESKAISRTEPLGPVPGGSERILLVGEDKALMDTVEVMLEYLGYEVVTRLSGADALNLLQDQPDRFALVIMDQGVSKTAPKEFGQKLRGICPGLPMILFGGFPDQVQEEDLKESGISAHLVKPLIMDDMARVIRQVIAPDNSR